MRKVLAVTLAIMMLASVAYARPSRTANTTTIVENDLDHPMGLGVDLKIAETKNQNVDITIQERYDFQNELNSLFFVVGIDVFKIIKDRKAKKETVVTPAPQQ